MYLKVFHLLHEVTLLYMAIYFYVNKLLFIKTFVVLYYIIIYINKKIMLFFKVTFWLKSCLLYEN